MKIGLWKAYYFCFRHMVKVTLLDSDAEDNILTFCYTIQYSKISVNFQQNITVGKCEPRDNFFLFFIVKIGGQWCWQRYPNQKQDFKGHCGTFDTPFEGKNTLNIYEKKNSRKSVFFFI